jgi:RHS repeat-associated protein
VLSVISDKVIPVFPYSNVISEMRADIRVAQDYSPFGVTLDGRNFVVSEGYRYGFQGQEVDDEVKGEGNSVNYKYRMHDPRLGRFFAIDPLASKYPFYSPYAFSGNIVVNSIELEGLEPFVVFTNVPGLFNAIFNSSSKTHMTSNPGIVFVCTDALGVQFTISRKMTTGELMGNRSTMIQTNQIPANQTDHSASIGSYTARATPVGVNLTVPLIVGSPNTVTNTVNGSSGYTGSETIDLSIAKGANQGAIIFDHFGQLINGFSVADQDGNGIPFIAPVDMGGVLQPDGTFSQGIVTFNIPEGVTSIKLTVTGVPDRRSGNGDQRVKIDQWNAQVTTNGPTTAAREVSDSYTTNVGGAVQQTTNGVRVDKTQTPTSLSNPVNH